MATPKSIAGYWTQPRTNAQPSKPLRTSPRFPRQRAESDTEQTLDQAVPINPQSASPLFKVPPEIRDYIFKYALTTYQDPDKPCNIHIQVPGCNQRTLPHHRPGHHHHLRTDTALLRTCRRVYSETALLPVSINTHILCYPDDQSSFLPVSTYFNRMTLTQLAAVQHIHLYIDRFHFVELAHKRWPDTHCAFYELAYLRGKKWGKNEEGKGTRMTGGPYPQTMTITIRNLENIIHDQFECDLHILGSRHPAGLLGGLKELKMELEFDDKEKEEEVLLPFIKQLKTLEWRDGRRKSLIAENVKEHWWIEPIKRPLGSDSTVSDEKKHYVATVVWKLRSPDQRHAG